MYDLERDNGRPLFDQQLGVWRHGAGGDAADIRMVTPGGDEEHNAAATVVWEIIHTHEKDNSWLDDCKPSLLCDWPGVG